MFSSLAYQSLGCGFDFVKELNPFPLPEYLVYVDCHTGDMPWKGCCARDSEELFEGDELQMRIVENYEHGLAAFPDSGMNLIRVDGRKKT